MAKRLVQYPGCQRLFLRGFRFRSSLKSDPREKLSRGFDARVFGLGRRRVGLRPTKLLVAREKKPLVPRVLVLWREGEIDKLLREEQIIRLCDSQRVDQPNAAKVFCEPCYVRANQLRPCVIFVKMMRGEGDVLPLSDDVMAQLREKHPSPQKARLGSLLFGPVEDVSDSIYQQIKGEMVRDAALQTKGSGAPSGVYANGFRRILASKSSKKSGTDLCAVIASMTRRLCTEFIDPLEAILANRLIPLDKGEGAVRPIGVGEVIRRIMGKCT